MKMERKIGKNGGITLPSSLRRDLGIVGKEKIAVEVLRTGDILIRRINGSCVFCADTENLTAYEGRYVCGFCADKLQQLRAAQEAEHGNE